MPTTEETKCSAIVYTWSVTLSIAQDRHARGDAGTKSWEELVSDGWSSGESAAVTEAKEKNFDADSSEEKTLGHWVHDLLDGPRARRLKLGDCRDTDIEAVRQQ